MAANRKVRKAEAAPEGPHLIGYARVSMADQDPKLQIKALLEAGVAREDIYHETASGAARKRPQFEAMMKDAREGDIVVVWKLDRLGRTTRQVLDTFFELERRGAKVRVLTQAGMDTSTPMGRMIVTVMAAVAELERDLIRERTAAGLAAARAEGRIGGRRSKFKDAEVREAAKLGTTAGAKKLGMSKAGFLKRISRMEVAPDGT